MSKNSIPICHGCGCFLEECTAFAPEPPDGTRIEFENGTDVYAAWRSDMESKRAGWTHGDGGQTWLVYGHTVPKSWGEMTEDFGACVLALAVRLLPHPDDLAKRAQWPTQRYAAAQAATGGQR